MAMNTIPARLAMLICGFGVPWTLAAPAEPTGESTQLIAYFRLSGPIVETPSGLELSLGAERPKALAKLIERFDKAAEDKRVAAVLLAIDQPSMGWAQMQELRAAIGRIRQAGKDVFCHIEAPGMKEYLLAAGCSYISIVPTGVIELTGLHTESPYIRNLLDKIGIEPDFEKIGPFKTAAEVLTRTEPSEASKKQINRLLDDVYEQIVETVATSRGLPAGQVRKLIDNGPYPARRALACKLVDAVAYRQELIAKIKDRYGASAVISRDYGTEQPPEIDLSSPFAFFQLLGQMIKQAQKPAKPSIAVVYVDGMLFQGKNQEGLFGDRAVGSTTLRAALNKARTDETIKAVVMRVDSPGGSIVASEIIWHAAKRIAEDGKPFVVSMGNLAGSGGYYIAAGAETIFAEPATITGSIGVLTGKLVTRGLWTKLGVDWYEFKRGQNADLFNTNRPWDDRERQIVRELMEQAYATFTSRVEQGRAGKLRAPLESLAGGRLFTGRQALENGLIDRIGGLADAIRYAADKAGIRDYEIRILPKPKGLLELLMEGLGYGEEDELAASAGKSLPGADAPMIRSALGLIRQLDPLRARCLLRCLRRIELLGQEPVLAVMPEEILIR